MIDDRIKQIQERGYENERICACGKDVPFLLAEIAKLTTEKQEQELAAFNCRTAWNATRDERDQALAERDAFDNALNNQAKLINLKETEYQDALARLKVAESALEIINKNCQDYSCGSISLKALAEIKGEE